MRGLITSIVLIAALAVPASAQRYYARERLHVVPDAPAEPPADPKGRVANGGFEDGAVAPWASAGTAPTLVQTNVRSGAYSLRFGAPGTSVSQTVATDARNYTLSFSCYATAGYSVKVRWNGVNVSSCGTGGNSAWTSGSAVVRGTGGDDVLSFVAPTTATGRMIDDVSLSPA
jgi:hypothetical protein